jgi:very-short-patch-repair endonuclease
MPPGCAVTVAHFDHRQREGVTVHQQRLYQADLMVIDGFPATTVPRTVCDLAMIISLARLRHVVETAHLDRLCTITSIGIALLRVGTIGRPGSERLVTVLDDLGPGEPVARTALEAKLDDVLDQAGLSNSVHQHPLPGIGRRSGLVDRAFPEAKLIIEADGRRWHARNAAMATDRQRDFEAARAGWFTLRIMHDQLVDDPEDTARGIAEIYEDRRLDSPRR